MKAQAETTLAKPRAKAEDAVTADSDALSASMRKLIVSFTRPESDRTSSSSDTAKEG